MTRPSRVVVSEHNVDEWPNDGLAPLPGRPGVFGYGFIPPSLFAQIKTRFLALAEQGRGSRGSPVSCHSHPDLGPANYPSETFYNHR
jgi:hypothetical protein